MNQEQKFCKDHQEMRMQKIENNKELCFACMELQYQNEIIQIDEKIKEYEKILSNSKSTQDRQSICTSLKAMEQQKIKLTNHFNERNTKNSQYKFRLINEYPINFCFSLKFNSDSTLLFAGGFSHIKVFKFKNGKKTIANSIKHTSFVYSLIFMNKSNLLVSGSKDELIVIWEKDQTTHWKPYQRLEGHVGVNLIMINNENEDLLISGSEDQNIKFWRKIDCNWICSQIIETDIWIHSLSLNQSQTKLIACGAYSSQEILVMQYFPESQEGYVTQEIECNSFGRQLCFISSSKFLFQGEQEFLEIYQFKQNRRKFIKEKKIQVQKVKWDSPYNSNPCKYLQSQGILIIQNGNYLNCLRIDEYNNYVLCQQIEFSKTYLIGNISNDGSFLVTQFSDNVSF